MEIYNLKNSIAYCEAKSLSLCFEAYADFSAGEEITEIGFNQNSGYVYICLDNGISICSAFSREVEFLINNFENGEETFFETYQEAEEALQTF